MNDFTKEELNQLIECVVSFSYIKEGHDSMVRIYPELETKLSDMIDNYCECDSDHVFDETDPYVLCVKCGYKEPLE